MNKKYFYKLINYYLSLHIKPETNIFNIFSLSLFFEEYFKDRNQIISINESFANKASNTSAEFLFSKQPDYILINGYLHYEQDIQKLLEKLHAQSTNDTRIIASYYSMLWKPLLKFITYIGARKKESEENWLTHGDVRNLFELSGFEVIKIESKILVPIYIPILSYLANKYLANIYPFSLFCLFNMVIARPLKIASSIDTSPSVSIVIPARNESGNIEAAIKRVPQMGKQDELIFIEGNSSDDTWDVIKKMQMKYSDQKKIIIAKQTGKGKGDAVRLGFQLAKNQILMILDADLTVPPEELPKFYKAVASGQCEFANGSRLVYPMEKQAMRFFNIIGNKFFAAAFSFVLNQTFKDTLCGTKVLTKKNYELIVKNRSYFGNFDPFGDFDLIFGASKLSLKIMEIPIKYRDRQYGSTNIQRWKHGLILFRMLIFAAKKIKFV